MSLLMTLIQQLILSSEGLVHGFCYNRMLEAKEGAPAPWIRMMGFWSVYIIEISVNWITGIRLPSFVNLSIAFGLTKIRFMSASLPGCCFWRFRPSRIFPSMPSIC